MRFRLSLLTLCITSSLLNQTTFAAALQFYELGTPIIGTAGVGQAAVASDASTAYFNPAGMGLLRQSQLMLGSQLMAPNIKFTKNDLTTITGDNGSKAGTLTPGMNVYYVYRFSPCLKFGISMTSPYGGSLNYTDGWVGRFIVQDVTFYTINLNPSVAYRINNWASIGGGVAIEYMNLQQTVAIPLIPFIDGQANIKVSNYAPGFNLGVMLTPNQSTKIGIAYRSKITHDLHGQTTFLRLAATPNTSTKMVMPQNVIMSVAQELGCQLTLLGELGWSNWSTMRNSITTIDNFTLVTPLNWKNTYRVGLGLQYKGIHNILLQTGVSYDSSPTTSTERLPDLPMDKQVRVGAGVIYSPMNAVKIGASYEYMNFGKANINNTSANGILAGSYSTNFINVIQLSINVGC